MNNTYYIGLDVHKETIAIAYACGANREDAVYHGQCGGSVPTAENCLAQARRKTRGRIPRPQGLLRGRTNRFRPRPPPDPDGTGFSYTGKNEWSDPNGTVLSRLPE